MIPEGREGSPRDPSASAGTAAASRSSAATDRHQRRLAPILKSEMEICAKEASSTTLPGRVRRLPPVVVNPKNTFLDKASRRS